jgi:hypothetical protein
MTKRIRLAAAGTAILLFRMAWISHYDAASKSVVCDTTSATG